jgi:hypothetical protein
MGVRLGNAFGQDVPLIGPDNVVFNGIEDCGHPVNKEIGIAWPATGARGVGATTSPIAGDWFAGATLSTRACSGDCSHETFSFPRVFQPQSWEEVKPEGWFAFCKTAYKPYDFAVTAFLVIAKHYLGDLLRVSTDGEDNDWHDAKVLCQFHLGYGWEMKISGDDAELKVA